MCPEKPTERKRSTERRVAGKPHGGGQPPKRLNPMAERLRKSGVGTFLDREIKAADLTSRSARFGLLERACLHVVEQSNLNIPGLNKKQLRGLVKLNAKIRETRERLRVQEGGKEILMRGKDALLLFDAMKGSFNIPNFFSLVKEKNRPKDEKGRDILSLPEEERVKESRFLIAGFKRMIEAEKEKITMAGGERAIIYLNAGVMINLLPMQLDVLESMLKAKGEDGKFLWRAMASLEKILSNKWKK